MSPTDGLVRLEADGLIRSGPEGARTTTRWQAAMARAAARLKGSDAPWHDLRLPIASALLEIYDALGDVELASLVEVMLPIEEHELDIMQAECDRQESPPSAD